MSGSDRHNTDAREHQARLGSLFAADQSDRASIEEAEGGDPTIPFPEYDEASGGDREEVWNASGAMTLKDFRRVREGYERGISPDALDRMHPERSTRPESHDGIVRARPEPYTRPVEPDHPLYAPAESERDLPELSDKRKGRLGPVAVTFILMTGIVGALALYAGGIDSIAGLFASQQSQSQEDLTRITARPETETESDLDGGPTPSETFAEEEEAPSSAAPDDGSQEAADGTTVETDGTERVAEEENDGAGPEADRKSNALDKESRTAPASSSRASSKPSRQTPTAQSENERTVQNTSIESARSEVAARNASTYTVQVGATTDKSEAERVAADARARGGSGVRLIETTKNGKPLYRIRFGSFSSEEEAIATARSIGFSDVWVVEN